MNTELSSFIAALATDGSDTTRLALADWLTERECEEQWQRVLDVFPADHLLRERFGVYLEGRGDGRGKGFRVLGVKGFRVDHFDGVFFWGSSANTYYTYKHCTLPYDWFRLVPRREGKLRPWGYEDEEPWLYGESRRYMEDKAARAFARLSPARQAELLGE